jgi:hypothetical protein
MAQSFCQRSNKKAMKMDWVALVRAHQDYFDFKNAEIARLMERVIVFEKRLSECEIRFAEWQES